MQIIHIPKVFVKPFDPREQAVLATDDYPVTRQSVRESWKVNKRERAKVGLPPLPKPLFKAPHLPKATVHDDDRTEQLERCAAIDVIADMVERWGADRVSRWVRFAADLRGQEIG